LKYFDLGLTAADIDPTVMSNLKDLSKRCSQYPSSTKCGDDLLTFLLALTDLNSLSLANTQVTNKIVYVMKELPALSQLELSGSKVTLKREKLRPCATICIPLICLSGS